MFCRKTSKFNVSNPGLVPAAMVPSSHAQLSPAWLTPQISSELASRATFILFKGKSIKLPKVPNLLQIGTLGIFILFLGKKYKNA